MTKSVRLTAADRQNIALNAAQTAFTKDQASLLKKEHELAVRLFAIAYPPHIQAAMEELQKLHPVFSTAQEVQSYVPGLARIKLKLPKAMLIGAGHSHYRWVDITGTDIHAKLTDELTKFIAESDAVEAHVSAMKKNVEVELGRYTTVEKLRKKWQEIVPFIPKHLLEEPQEKASLPAVIIDDLNARLKKAAKTIGKASEAQAA